VLILGRGNWWKQNGNCNKLFFNHDYSDESGLNGSVITYVYLVNKLG